MASLLPYRKVQRNDKGFDFYDGNGQKTTIENYTRATGANGSQLRHELAQAGDVQSRQIIAKHSQPLQKFNSSNVDDQRKSIADLEVAANRKNFNVASDVSNAAWAKDQLAQLQNYGINKQGNAKTFVADLAKGFANPAVTLANSVLDTLQSPARDAKLREVYAKGGVSKEDYNSGVVNVLAGNIQAKVSDELDENGFAKSETNTPLDFLGKVTREGADAGLAYSPIGSTYTNVAKMGTKAAAPAIIGSILKEGTAYTVANVGNDALQGRKITPESVLMNAAMSYGGAAVGAGGAIAKPAIKNATTAVKNYVDEPIKQAAEQASGLKALNVLNDNEAYTLSDYADIAMKRYDAPNDVRNKVSMQARNAAQTAGLDIINLSPADADSVISRYLNARDNYKTTYDYAKRTMAQGGYIKLPGNASDDLVKKVFTKQTDGNSLYHGTTPENAISILNDGQIRASIPNQKELFSPEIQALVGSSKAKDLTPYVSFGRNRNQGIKLGNWGKPVRLVADNEKVKQSAGKTHPYVDGELNRQSGSMFEAEQRVAVKSVPTSTLKRVEYDSSLLSSDEVTKLKVAAKKAGIDIVDTQNPSDMRRILDDTPKTPQSPQAKTQAPLQAQSAPLEQQAPKVSPRQQQLQPTASLSRASDSSIETPEPKVQSRPSAMPIAKEQTRLVQEPQSSVHSIQQKPTVVKEQRRAIKDGADATYGLRESFDAADNVPDELKMSLGAFGNSRTVKTNKELWQNAQQRTGLDSAEAMKYFNENNNDEAVATGYALINKYMKSGNTKEAGDIAMTMAERALESGRQTQAYAMMKKLTPEGSIAYVARKVNKYLDKNPKMASKVKWNDQVQKDLYKLAEEVNALPEGRARNLKIGELQMKIDNIFPSSLADKAITVWKAGLLTSLRTQERNIVGNFTNAVSEQVSTIPGSIADRIMSLRTKKRTLMASQGEGLGSGAKYGGEIALDQLRTGIDVTDSNLKMNVNHITWGDGVVEKVLKGYTESVFRTLGASDKVFKEAARNSSLYNQALAMGYTKKYKGAKFDDYIKKLVKSPTAKMLEIADNDASRATFTHDNVLGDLVKKGKQSLRNQKSQIPSAVADVIVPFTQVPTGVASQLFAYSPANLFKSLYDISKVLITGNKDLQRGAAQGFGRSVVGTAIMGGGAYLMAQGLMTGQPEDDAEKAQWEAEGKMPNSIKIGDKWYQLGSIGPQTILLLAGAQGMKDYQEGRNPLVTTAGNLAKNFKDQTFLKGMSSALDAVDDPKRYATSFMESTATSVIPNIVKDVAKWIDPNVREAQGVVDRFKASLPGVSKSLPERLDSYGQPLKNRGIGAMIDLFNSSKEKEIPEASYIDALRESVGTSEHVPTKADRTITINGATKKLNSQELHDYQEYIGVKGKEMIARASQDAHFKDLTGEEKAGEIDKQLQAINTAAKIKLFGHNPKTQSADVKNVLKSTDTSLTVSSSADANATPAEKYQKTLEDYNKNKDTMSDIKRYATEGSLKKMKVAAPFSNDVIDLYGMSKEKIYDFVTSNKNGKKLVDQITAYDKALQDAGLIATLKFKTGIAPATKKAGGSSASKAPTGLAEALNTTQAIKTPKFAKAESTVSTTPAQRKTALKTYNAARSTKITAKRGVSRTV